MTLTQQLRDYIAAAFSGIWLQTHEPDEARREIAQLADDEQWNLEVWDVARGSHRTGLQTGDPVMPLHSHTQLKRDGRTVTNILLLHNYHRFLQNPMVVQALANKVTEGKADRLFFVVLAPVVQIPPELEKLFLVLEHELPDTPALSAIAADLTKDDSSAFPSPETLAAAAGLTRYEAENTFALSLARHERIEASVVWELKAQTLKKSGLLEMHRGTDTFRHLGGLDSLKSFCKKALASRKPQVRAKGVLLLGVPGTGKSAFAKALGNETGRPTLVLEVGALLGSLVGQTEENVRRALRIADAMSPCVVFIDEIEKALSGVGSNNDSGVSARLFGTLLTWLNDHTSDVFVVATSNDVSKLPPEFSRAERWDGIFFLDLPTKEEQTDIWNLYRREFHIPDADDAGFEWRGWTGAEIKSCCRLAALLDVPLAEAARHVVPVAVTAQDKVAALREWASGRCLSASAPGIYHAQPPNGNHRPRRTLKENA